MWSAMNCTRSCTDIHFREWHLILKNDSRQISGSLGHGGKWNIFLCFQVTTHLIIFSGSNSGKLWTKGDFVLDGFVGWFVAQLCLTLCDPMDCSPPGSSVHGILQARILEWVPISSSRGSSRPRNWTPVSCISWIGRQILCHCATWEALLDKLLSLLSFCDLEVDYDSPLAHITDKTVSVFPKMTSILKINIPPFEL